MADKKAQVQDEPKEELETELDNTPEEELEGKAEGEAEPEAEPEAKAEEELKEEPKGFMIPKSRYDSVKGRLLSAQEENRLLKEQAEGRQADTTASPDVDFDAQIAEMDKQYAAALADGDSEKAAGIRRETRKLEREQIEAELSNNAKTVSAQTRDQVRYDALLTQFETDYPLINPDSEDYDQDIEAEIIELKEAFQARGSSASDALNRAVGYVLRGGTAEASPTAEPRKTDVERNLKTANAQPPALKGGRDSDKAGMKGKINIFKLSTDEFDELGEEQLSQLRGDNY